MKAFLKPFDGFVAGDFETYEPAKWSSNLYNLQRMQVKQKLTALASALEPVLEELGLELDSEVSSERPSIWNHKQVRNQWLYFFRNARLQRELLPILDRERSLAENIEDPAHHHRHMVLGVRVDASGVSVVCGAHPGAWLDRRNLRQKCQQPHERVKLAALIRRLKNNASWCRGGERLATETVDEATIESSWRDGAEADGWLAVECHFPADAEVVGSSQLVGAISDVLRGLAPIYKFCAWSKDNDHASMAQVVDTAKEARRKKRHLPFDENDEVVIVGGLFAGQRGFVQGFDGAGKVKVKVGTLTLPVRAGSLKLVSK